MCSVSRMGQNYISVMLRLPTGNKMLLQTLLIIKVAFLVVYLLTMHKRSQKYNQTHVVCKCTWGAKNIRSLARWIELYWAPCIGKCLVYVLYLLLLSLKWAEYGINLLISEKLICELSTYMTIIRRKLHISYSSTLFIVN